MLPCRVSTSCVPVIVVIMAERMMLSTFITKTTVALPFTHVESVARLPRMLQLLSRRTDNCCNSSTSATMCDRIRLRHSHCLGHPYGHAVVLWRFPALWWGADAHGAACRHPVIHHDASISQAKQSQSSNWAYQVQSHRRIAARRSIGEADWMLAAWSDCLRRIRQISVRDARFHIRLQSIHNSAYFTSRDPAIVLCSDCLGALAAKLKLRTLSVTLMQLQPACRPLNPPQVTCLQTAVHSRSGHADPVDVPMIGTCVRGCRNNYEATCAGSAPVSTHLACSCRTACTPTQTCGSRGKL